MQSSSHLKCIFHSQYISFWTGYTPSTQQPRLGRGYRIGQGRDKVPLGRVRLTPAPSQHQGLPQAKTFVTQWGNPFNKIFVIQKTRHPLQVAPVHPKPWNPLRQMNTEACRLSLWPFSDTETSPVLLHSPYQEESHKSLGCGLPNRTLYLVSSRRQVPAPGFTHPASALKLFAHCWPKEDCRSWRPCRRCPARPSQFTNLLPSSTSWWIHTMFSRAEWLFDWLSPMSGGQIPS